jgi:TOBE domain
VRSRGSSAADSGVSHWRLAPADAMLEGAITTSSITNEAVEEFRLATGEDAYAVIKASDVMVGRD